MLSFFLFQELNNVVNCEEIILFKERLSGDDLLMLRSQLEIEATSRNQLRAFATQIKCIFPIFMESKRQFSNLLCRKSQSHK